MESKLRQLLNDGYSVMQSPLIKPGTLYSFDDVDGRKALVFHPMDYTYLAYSDPFEAHALNMLTIRAKIESMAVQANRRLDEMVDEMNEKHLAKFDGPTEALEGEDGLWIFKAIDRAASMVQHPAGRGRTFDQIIKEE